jgi:HK97 family phage major capsid protein/HK97 family phage prohead protease
MTTQDIPANLRTALDKTTGAKVQRAFMVQREAINEEARTAVLAFASETPYERYWGIEILDCTATSMRLGRMGSGANLLCDHDQRDVVGVVESVEIGADRVARAVVRFGKSERAEEVWQDVRDGIRRNVSVGYMIHKAVMVEAREGVETYRVTDWEPFEVSLVSVPADASVGVGRALEAAAEPAPPKIEPVIKEETKMTEAVVQVKEERNHPLEITKLAATIKDAGELALKSIQAGHTVEQFQAELLRHMSSRPLPTPDIGITEKETKQYSVLRAIRAMVDKDWSQAGFERECHAAILKRAGMGEAPNNGFFVPYEVQKRDLTASTANQGGVLVQTNVQAQSFIEMLRARTVVGQLGATMLSGLTGNVTIPRQTAAGTAVWLANEASSITESQAVLGQLSLAPKNVGAYTEISRQLMLQSSAAADQLVMNDLVAVLARAIDLAALEGSGASGQPTGISLTAGIGAVTGTTLAYAGIIEFQSDVAAANALTPNCAYVTTPAVAALLSARQRFASTDTPLWQGSLLDATMVGFRAQTTTAVTAASMVFGDFSSVVIGEWGMLELAMNPYANFQAAITGIRAIQTVDVGIRYAGSFSRATAIT